MDFADGVLQCRRARVRPSVAHRPGLHRGRITHAEYMRRAGLVPPGRVERQQRERVARDFKQGKIDEAEFLLRFLYGDDGDWNHAGVAVALRSVLIRWMTTGHFDPEEVDAPSSGGDATGRDMIHVLTQAEAIVAAVDPRPLRPREPSARGVCSARSTPTVATVRPACERPRVHRGGAQPGSKTHRDAANARPRARRCGALVRWRSCR